MAKILVPDIKTLTEKGIYYANFNPRAVDILKNADGKNNYREIAKELKVHETTVSACLRLAFELGLAGKNGKFYKKIPGILKYIPKAKAKHVQKDDVSDILRKAERKKIKFNDSRYETAFGVKLSDNAGKMASAYMWLFVTENTLRELIRKVFEKEQDWWKKRVNCTIQKDVENAKQSYPYHGAKRKDELEYTHIGQLAEIIISKNNWSDFANFLNEKNKSSFQATVNKVITSRNSIAHCTPLTKEDFECVVVRFKEILKMIKNK